MSLVDGEAIGSSGFSMGGVIGASISSLSHPINDNYHHIKSFYFHILMNYPTTTGMRLYEENELHLWAFSPSILDFYFFYVTSISHYYYIIGTNDTFFH